MTYLMCIKDCYTKEWQGFHYSRSCMAKDAIRSVENAVLMAFNGSVPEGLVLRTDNGPQYISHEFRRKFLDDPAFRERFEKKEVEVTLDD